MLAEFDAAVEEERAKEEGQVSNEPKKEGEKKEKKGSYYASADPKTLHCRRCNTLMEGGVCPTCGYKVYVPMDEAKRKKIRGIMTVVCLAVFVVLFVAIKLAK